MVAKDTVIVYSLEEVSFLIDAATKAIDRQTREIWVLQGDVRRLKAKNGS